MKVRGVQTSDALEGGVRYCFCSFHGVGTPEPREVAMSNAVEIREIHDDSEAQFLMPGGGSGLHLVMCCTEHSEIREKVKELAPSVDIPEGWDFVWLNPNEATETARWFGLSDASGMAVIKGGQLLAVECECSLDGFERLIELAKRQTSLVDAES